MMMRAWDVSCSRFALAVTALGVGFGCGGDPVEPPNTDVDPVVLRGAWHQAAPMPEVAPRAGIAVVNGMIYVVGGTNADQSEASARALRFDPVANQWSRLPDLPEALASPAAAALGDTLIVLGGSFTTHGIESSDDVWKWDEASDQWVHHSVLPLPAIRPLAVGTQLGVIAGALGTVSPPPGDSTAFLADGTSTWVFAAPAPMAAVAITGGEGGVWSVGSSQHADFDPSTGQWGAPSALPVNEFHVAAWRVPGRRHLLTRIATTTTHWVLEDGASAWGNAKAPTGLSRRSGPLSVSVGGALYVIGGVENGIGQTSVDVFTWS